MKKVEFKVVPHDTRDCDVVEIHVGGKFRAVVYADDKNGDVRLISRYVSDVVELPDPVMGTVWNFSFHE